MTPDITATADRLREIRSFPSLVKYLREELEWPVETDDFEELTFEWAPEDLGIDPVNAAKIDEIKQLRPLNSAQPWGVFFVKFEPKRLPIVALRRLLNSLVLRKRVSATKAERRSWHMNDLMFISSYGESGHRHISFAHFAEPAEQSRDIPTLRVLGWDGDDTTLALDYAAQTLRSKLTWPTDESDVAAWRRRWAGAFVLRPRQVITKSAELAERLADAAKAIHVRANNVLALENERGPLRELYGAFKKALLHDLSEHDFADTYAQTICYGLFSAAVWRAELKEQGGTVSADLPAMMLTNPFLRELLETFLHVGGRRKKFDFDELGIQDVVELLNSPDTHLDAILRDFGNRSARDDPVIHFYEEFLERYDKGRKVRQGVFYTPQPVVRYIIRSVDDALREDLGLIDGLATVDSWREVASKNPSVTIPQGTDPNSHFVCLLDPAVGTATFLVEAIDVIHETLRARWIAGGASSTEREKLWNDYVVDHLLPRLYGFEIMMAPYAIAHIKIALKLRETGFSAWERLANTRVNIFLTDSLEPHQDFSGLLSFAVPALAHEATAVNDVKDRIAFTVIVGNPPYLREKVRGPGVREDRIGGWIRFGDPQRQPRPLFDDFIGPLAKLGLGVHAKLAYELSVMFWRLALWLVFERRSTPGVVGMISPRAYISGPGHAGMRQWIRSSAKSVWVTDLGGDNRGARKSENIFDIETGVAICVAARNRPATPTKPCTVRYKVIDGSAADKLRDLDAPGHPIQTPWTTCREGQDSFLPEPGSAYANWPKLIDIFPWQHSGSQFKRLWAIAESPDVLRERWRRLVSLPPARRPSAFVETRDRVAGSPPSGSASRKYTRIASLGRSAPVPEIIRYCYRSLDRQWCLLDDRVADYLRPALVYTRSKKQVYAATLMSKPLGQGPAIAVSSLLPDMDVFCNRGAKDVIPLWRDPAGREPNVTRGLLECLSRTFAFEVTPGGLLAYCAAILGGPAYAKQFAAELSSPGPRIPLTSDPALFRQGTLLGSRFAWFQTFGERWLGPADQAAPPFRGAARMTQPISDADEHYPESYRYDASTRILSVGTGQVAPVDPEVYGYSMSGFAVVESWLRYRMKTRGGRAKKEGARSELDEIRPARWQFSEELLELLWAVEGCVGLWNSLETFLARVQEGPLFNASDLPAPTAAETKEPEVPDAAQSALL